MAERLLLVDPDGHFKTVAFLKWARGKGHKHLLRSGITVETLTDEEFEEAKTFGMVTVVAIDSERVDFELPSARTS